MCEAAHELFNKLWQHENAINKIGNFLRNQNTFNKGTVLCIAGMSMYMLLQSKVTVLQQKKIDILANEIKELKKMKGE